MSSPPSTSPSDTDLDADRFDDEAETSAAPSLLANRRRVIVGSIGVLLAIVAIYVLLPMVAGLDDALARVSEAESGWIFIALIFVTLQFGAYVALLQAVIGGTGNDAFRRRIDFSASYEITMAALAATRLFSAAGAGGIALIYWALRRAGLARRQAACRMVAFNAILYVFYLVVLVVFGVLLRAGVLPGPAPVGGTIVPAAVAGIVLGVVALMALIPGDLERRLVTISDSPRRTARFARRLATVPATVATGFRTAADFLREPRRGVLAVAGAVGFWGAQIGILWASFEAFGGGPSFGVLIQGFFVGMAANLIPSPAGGVGSVDAGMIATFLMFGMPAEVVFPAILAYRVIAFWLPIPPGIVAYLQLRRTVAGWDRERAAAREARYTSESKVTVEAT